MVSKGGSPVAFLFNTANPPSTSLFQTFHEKDFSIERPRPTVCKLLQTDIKPKEQPRRYN